LRALRVLSLMTGVLLTGAGAIALMRAALMISADGCICAVRTVERQQRLRDPRFDFRFMVEMRNEALDDLAHVNLDTACTAILTSAPSWPASRARL
jgi:hypothetical protein